MINTQIYSTTMAYLIGTRLDILYKNESEDVRKTIRKLSEEKNAVIIRNLSRFRTELMKHFGEIDSMLKNETTNISDIRYFNITELNQLADYGIDIIRYNWNAQKYMELVNRCIAENINIIRAFFPANVKWEYIKDLFLIPDFTNVKNVINETRIYRQNFLLYPYSMYIHWKPMECNNLLSCDSKFFKIVYSLHNDSFNEEKSFTDAHDFDKERIYAFIDNGKKISMFVDCENSDVYKLFAVLKELNNEHISRINEIVLVDDVNTNIGWELLEKCISVKVRKIDTKRVIKDKSVVDGILIAEICKAYYSDEVDSVIMVSSDSDYLSVIRTVKVARFMTLYESEKISPRLIDEYIDNNVAFCCMDNFFIGNSDSIKIMAFKSIIRQYGFDVFKYNGKDFAERVFEEARINASKTEIQNFYEKYIRTLRPVADAQGNFVLDWIA